MCSKVNSFVNILVLGFSETEGGNTMPTVSHQRAAELHELAAQAHLIASAHHGEEDHETGHKLSKHALEHANKAYQMSLEAHWESGKTATSKS